jgi:hypothetical protein
MQAAPPTETRNVYFNRAQRLSLTIKANIEAWIVGRGGGKTRGIIAPRMAHIAFAMQRSLNGFVVPSVKKFMLQFVPSVYAGLDELGYTEGKDYLFAKEPPAKWHRPHNRPRDWEYTMSWRSGSAYAFISQDRPGSGNGLSFDSTLNDESKLTDEERLDNDYMPAVRGNDQHFGGMWEHGSLMLCSDRPTTKNGKWIYRYRDLVNKDVITWIQQLVHKEQEITRALAQGHLTALTQQRYRSDLNKIAEQLNVLRKEAVYYGEASVLDNIHVLGMPWLLNKEKTTTPLIFRTAYLNEDVDFVTGGFYPDFSEDLHTYNASLSAYTLTKGFQRDTYAKADSQHDMEIMPDLPLDIAMDYGANINCMAIGQQFEDLFRIDNGLHVQHPLLTVDVVRAFIQYYKTHRNKRVHYYFDKTARDHSGLSSFCYEEVVIEELRKADWDVVPVWIGQQPSPGARYEMWSSLFRQGARCPVMFNRDNCEDMITSMRLCQVRDGRDGKIEKNKTMEGKGEPEDELLAPHYSDAVDTLVWGRRNLLDRRSGLPTPSIRI